MIIEPPKSWVCLLFTFQDPVIVWIDRWVLFITLLATVLTMAHLMWFPIPLN